MIPSGLGPVLERLGLTVQAWTPLTGGVSSDIHLVVCAERSVVAKRALARLRVAAEWSAPVERSATEAAWLAFASDAVPGCCPRPLAYDAGWLVVEHVDGRTWKTDLLAGDVSVAVARGLGDRLGRVHAAAAATPGLAGAFATDEQFDALRLDPYLRSLPVDVSALVETTRTTRRTLVHGDVSPKNVLVTADGPVLLDAECAWWGDPAFDVAFLLTHVVLKAVHLPACAKELDAAAAAFTGAYVAHVTWEPRAAVAARAAALLPALALARVDGKSPVEYLDAVARETVRARATRLLGGSAPLAVTVATLAAA